MASAKNPIASRVKAHRQQVKGMLTPGLSAPTRDGSASRLPALFTQFGVGKPKLAASKMRFLDHRRMGKVHSERTKAFSEAIPQKFQQAQTLLRINPRMSREPNIWSELERTLPSQGGSYEEPAQPGELRAGSVIQKFSMFPKEGQSIESFKEQVRSMPKPPTRQQTERPKPSVSPKSRLFSRVQEISSTQAETPTERSPEQPTPAKQEKVQRQVDSAPPPPKQDAPSIPKEVPPAIESEPVKEETPQEPAPKAERPTAKPAAVKVSPPTDLRLKKVAKPVKKVEKPVGKVAKTAPQTDQQTADAKPAPPTVQRKVDAKPAPQTDQRTADAKPAPPTVQRKVDAKPAVKPTQPKAESKQDSQPVKEALPIKEERPQVKKEAVREPIQEKDQSLSPQTETSLPEKEEASQKNVPPAPAVDMPLRKKIKTRREAPKALKSLRPEKLKPAEQKPLLAPPPRPLISRQKYSRAETPIASTDESVPQQPPLSPTHLSQELPEGFAELDSFFREHTGQQAPDPSASRSAEPMRDGRQQLPMALARLPRVALSQATPHEPLNEQAPQPELRSEPELLPKPEEQRLEEPTLPIQAGAQELKGGNLASGQNIVQRQPDDDTGDSASAEILTPDLDQLAEDVLPYVKRILEIESERIPGSLR